MTIVLFRNPQRNQTIIGIIKKNIGFRWNDMVLQTRLISEQSYYLYKSNKQFCTWCDNLISNTSAYYDYKTKTIYLNRVII